MKTSQKQNILRHLLYGPLCGQEQDWTLGRRIPARIHELRQTGFQIRKRRCEQGHDHRTHQIEFYLARNDQFVTDYCADCGRLGWLEYTDGPPLRLESRTLFAVKCDECGKGDWR